ncbi:PREDICTED: 4F2 cell-surface antigen heavy chain [Elephantulus edwardii]|uniref:4F2 cell-surface antigen heavy chain n=1 Tax=Elephantulus edwardii TaxID=28737 RepID=UPI0003F09CE3|nr:PREDICTED: 4F2 cell-surface antigen heavy chain [Elephantulus edwardii]
MNQDTEVDMKEVELNELEPEKQPMNAAGAGAEKNGLVKLKVANDDEVASAKFTGLSKEELLKVAGSPGWVRTRWLLLVLFWLGWLGMLAGAVVIIVQAPRCRPLPAQRWWHTGALYRISDIQAFQADSAGNLAGLGERLDYLSTLKVKGVVLGPVHHNQPDDIDQTNLKLIDPTLGSNEDFEKFLQSAKKKSIRVILDLTPNYKGQNSWFLPNQVEVVASKMKDALEFWLQAGVDGFQVRNVEYLMNESLFLAEWQNITQRVSEDKLLIAGMNSSDLQKILQLLNSDFLLTNSYLTRTADSVNDTQYLFTHYWYSTGNPWCTWSISQAGLLTSFVPASLLRLYHLLFFTLPGTPIFSYGDEIGLEAAALPGKPGEAPVMLWDEFSLLNASRPGARLVNVNETVKGQEKSARSSLNLFRMLSGERVKERSLLHGDFHTLSSGPSLFSYIRQWDQNKRFLVVLNFGDMSTSVSLKAEDLPPTAQLMLSTEPERKVGVSLELQHLNLAPNEGLLFNFPYVA